MFNSSMSYSTPKNNLNMAFRDGDLSRQGLISWSLLNTALFYSDEISLLIGGLKSLTAFHYYKSTGWVIKDCWAKAFTARNPK
jgi:hypothetical protein